MSKRITPYLDSIMNPGGINFPVKRGTWDFIEKGWMEEVSQVIKTMIGNSYSSTVVYVLQGCSATTLSGITYVTDGSIFFNGEIYIYQGGSFSNPSSGNIIVNLVETSWQPTDAAGNLYADPVAFIGGTSSNIHIDRTCTFLLGASGTGTISNTNASDYVNFVYVDQWNNTPSLALLSSPSTTVTLNSTTWSRYKIINGTLFWNAKINVTISSGTPTYIEVVIGSSIGGTFYNRLGYQNSAIWNVANPCIVQLYNEGSACSIRIYPVGFSFSGSSKDIDINVFAEIVQS